MYNIFQLINGFVAREKARKQENRKLNKKKSLKRIDFVSLH
jgi:hypothetical protein